MSSWPLQAFSGPLNALLSGKIAKKPRKFASMSLAFDEYGRPFIILRVTFCAAFSCHLKFFLFAAALHLLSHLSVYLLFHFAGAGEKAAHQGDRSTESKYTGCQDDLQNAAVIPGAKGHG